MSGTVGVVIKSRKRRPLHSFPGEITEMRYNLRTEKDVLHTKLLSLCLPKRQAVSRTNLWNAAIHSSFPGRQATREEQTPYDSLQSL